MLKEFISKVADKQSLTESEMAYAMGIIMDGKATPAQIASFITALRMKGETVEEITGAARIMRERALRVRCSAPVIIDTCGTGGDGTHTFNISTLAALISVGAGLTVAKHGNRSVSSKCGSADVLKELGVNIEAPLPVIEECLEKIGIAFLFAPNLHTAMKYAIGPRREIGIRTVFNILGPLTNPAFTNAQVVGVYSPDLTETIAQVLGKLGNRKAMVVHGDGLDEITLCGETKISEYIDGEVKTFKIRPEDFGFRKCSIEDLKGGDPSVNAQIMISLLKGEKGPRRDITLLNAGAALYIGGKVRNIEEGIKLAAEIIDSGAALNKLNQLIELTNKYVS